MKLTREKILKLSHIITDYLVASQDVEFIEDRATIRQGVVDIIKHVLKDEETVDNSGTPENRLAKEGKLKAVKSGTYSIANIMPKSFAAWESSTSLTLEPSPISWPCRRRKPPK